MGRTLAVVERRLAIVPAHYIWSFPGSPLKVQLDLGVVERLQKQLQCAAAEQGLLLGKAAGSTTEVHDFAAVPGPQPDIHAVAASVPRPHLPVGYYRIEHNTPLRLNAGDLSLAEEVFPHPHQVFLLIQPNDSGPANATFFFWDEGKMRGDFPFLEFPLDSSLLAAEERHKLATAQPKASESGSVDFPSGDRQADSPRKATKTLKVVGQIFTTLVISVSFAVMAVRLFPGKVLAVISPPTLSMAPTAPSKQIPLGLNAERQNGDLKLTWNREAVDLLSATSGVLSIEEGGGKRAISLGSIQVRSGSILYVPTTGEVQIQLTVSGPQNTTTESVIVIVPKFGSPQVQTLAPKAARQVEPPSLAEVSRNPAKPFTTPVDTDRSTAAPTIDEPPAPNVRSELATPALINSPLPELSVIQPPKPGPPQLAVPTQGDPVVQQGTGSAQQTPEAQRYHPPVIVRQVMPTFPPALKAMFVTPKTVEINVVIDETGKVQKAEPLPRKGSVPDLMVRAAIDSARLWTFKPAQRGIQPISSEMVLRFQFKPTQ